MCFGLGLAGGPTAAAAASDLDLSDAEQLYHTGHWNPWLCALVGQ